MFLPTGVITETTATRSGETNEHGDEYRRYDQVSVSEENLGKRTRIGRTYVRSEQGAAE